MRFLVVVTGWNCKDYVKKCLDSIYSQDYADFIVSIWDDGSTDGTYERVLTYLQNEPTQLTAANVFTENCGAIIARTAAMEQLGGWDVVATVDMDDELRPGALSRVAKEYQDGKWMTYGTYIDSKGFVFTDLDFDEETHNNRDYRKVKWRSTVLRTMKKELYYAALPADPLKCEIESYPDAELMFACMEMCGRDRIGVIREPIYLFNESRPMNTLERFSKNLEGYKLITERPKRDLW